MARFACPRCQTQQWGTGARPSPGVLSCVCLSASFSCLPCDHPPCNSTALESSWHLASRTLLNELAVGMICEMTALEALPRPQSRATADKGHVESMGTMGTVSLDLLPRGCVSSTWKQLWCLCLSTMDAHVTLSLLSVCGRTRVRR